MSEYWVSKKQYWCKYCNIWIRDDAPSRSLHESGLKHQGNKERYIREIYRGGERAKREKEANAKEFARIEAAAKAAHAKDTGVYAGRPVSGGASPAAASSSRTRPKATGDKWSNYSSATQLGFDDEDTKLSSYEIEQMVRGRGTQVGKWEEVKEPTPTANVVYGEDGVPMMPLPPAVDEDNHENFKFSHKDKRPIRDVYDDDDWDPSVLTGIKLKSKERKLGEGSTEAEMTGSKAGWAKVGATGEQTEGEVKSQVKAEGDVEEVKTESDVKVEPKDGESGQSGVATDAPLKPSPSVDVKPDIKPDVKPDVKAEAPTTSGGSMFKKRRPPPSSRKK